MSTLPDHLRSRIVRYDELRPHKQSFIDARSPGSEDKESFSVIGGGVVENRKRHVHIDVPHPFNMGGARMPPGIVNGQHSHVTAEVFLLHRGTFTFTLGPNREDGELRLTLGDTISIPTRVFRGFRNDGDEVGHLVSVIGGPDPGKVTWAPYIFEDAQEHGLVLLQDGRLIDTHAGDTVPKDVPPVAPTTEADVAALDRIGPEQMEGWYVREASLVGDPASPLAADGVEECLVIGPPSPGEGLGAAPISAPHGFHLRRVRMQSGATIPAHSRAEEEVLFVQSGAVRIGIEGQEVTLERGDYFTLPIGMPRTWEQIGDGPTDVQVTRGGDAPDAPHWTD